MKIARNTALFVLGGSAYVALELLWRGRSHVSMFAAGGTCFLLLGKIRRMPRLVQPLAGTSLITAVELGTGLLVNRDYHVWDYRNLPGNYRGQICPLFSALWIPVSMAGIGIYEAADKIWQKPE